MRRVTFVVILLIVLALVVLPVGGVGQEEESCEGDLLTSASNTTYCIIFDNGSIINFRLMDYEQETITGLRVATDGQDIYREFFHLENKTSFEDSVSVTNQLRLGNDTHEVTVGTFGKWKTYTFHRDIDVDNPGPVQIPYIRKVRIENDEINGKPSSVAYITVHNPSIQPYGMKLMVHTEGTDGSYYLAATSPGTNRTIKVELLDERGSLIAGEARLYLSEMDDPEDAVDQVGFMGRADGKTQFWNESYEPIEEPWEGGEYEYENESIPTDTGLIGFVPPQYHEPLSYLPWVLLVVVVGRWYRRRRRRL